MTSSAISLRTDHGPEYAQAIEYLYGRINYERTNLRPYSATHYRLDRMRRLLEELGSPQDQLRIIHIAGTKGKGSTATLIANACSVSGIKTGLYTSPHLLWLEERFKVDGQMASPLDVVRLVDRIGPAAERLADAGLGRPTFFEMTTALALLHFVEQNADAAVLEVGLGGRLDSTNIVSPEITAITSISLDHQAQLGDTVELIAAEKAGIIKPEIPVVCGVRTPGAQAVIHQIAKRQVSPIRQLGSDFFVKWNTTERSDISSSSDTFDYSINDSADERNRHGLTLAMLGRHQADNAAVAISVCDWLIEKGWKINESAIRKSLATSQVPARIEVVQNQPEIILDAAHNVASMRALLDTLDIYYPNKRRIAIFAASRDKDFGQLLEMMASKFEQILLTKYCENPRSVPVDELAKTYTEMLSSQESSLNRPTASIETYDSPQLAWQRSQQILGRDELLCITGSFFLAAELLPLIQSEKQR